MKSKSMYSSFAVATLITATLYISGISPAWGQVTKPKPLAVPTYSATSTINNFPNGVGHVLDSRRIITIKTKQKDQQLKRAVNLYKNADTDAKKEKAKLEISSGLSAYFNADMKNREQDIASIEKRVKKLRTLLEKRRAAKDKIVDLQLKVLINQAEGLGFYGKPVSSGQLPRMQNPSFDFEVQFDDLEQDNTPQEIKTK